MPLNDRTPFFSTVPATTPLAVLTSEDWFTACAEIEAGKKQNELIAISKYFFMVSDFYSILLQ